MNRGTRPAGIHPDLAEEGAIKSWLDALASGSCDVPAFLRAMQLRASTDPDATWEVLSQLDQYYRRGRIENETFNAIKTALAESALGLGSAATTNSPVRAASAARETTPDVPVARDVVIPARVEQTDAHPRRELQDSVGELKPGSVLRRRYRIEAVIGQGGMGTVFQVLDEFRLESPGTQRVAVKVLHPAAAKRAELLAELRREFQSLQLLSHPNIVRVFDFDRDGPSVFFTMELLTGATLNRLLQARQYIPLERARALAVIRDIGAALAYAHTRGAVHGDLNLQNIFITGSGELRVMSFGSSHRARLAAQAPDPEMTLPFSASTCASCQVLEGERADSRDDVFSLACLAHLLLSGSHPFPQSTAMEARDAKLRIRRPANLSNRQWRALRSALSWEREDRPAEVQRWISELELRGAARRLAPLSDLLQAPAAKKPKPWLAARVAAGVAVLLFAVYWGISHRNRLPGIADNARPPAGTASASSPSIDQAKPPSTAVSPPPLISPPAAHQAPVAAAPLVATAPPVATPPVAATATSPTARVAAPVSSAAAGAAKVELATDTVDVPAGVAYAQVVVHRKGNLRGETSFTWWTESGTAKPGADFSAVVPQLAYVANGKSAVSLSIPVSNAPHAQEKSFYVVIDQSEGGAALGARTLSMVTLLPSD